MLLEVRSNCRQIRYHTLKPTVCASPRHWRSRPSDPAGNIIRGATDGNDCQATAVLFARVRLLRTPPIEYFQVAEPVDLRCMSIYAFHLMYIVIPAAYPIRQARMSSLRLDEQTHSSK